jgi:hypothetical protein
MLIEAAHGKVSLVEVHTHHRAIGSHLVVQALSADDFGSRWGAGPCRGEVPARPAGPSGDGIRHGLAAGGPGPPLVGAIGEHRCAGEDVAAVWGVGQVLQRFGQPQADLPVRGDGNGEVAERFIAGALGVDTVTGAVPLLAPPELGQVRRVEVVAGLGQPLTTLHHPHPMVVPVGRHAAQLGLQHLQPTLLLKPFGLGRISLRQLGLSARPTFLSGEGVVGGCRQSLLEGGDRRAQPDEVAVLGAAGQPVLGVIAGDDRIGPPRTGLRGQRLLAHVEPIPTRLPLGLIVHRRIQRRRSADGGQVPSAQRAHMLGNQIEHPIVLGGGSQPGGDRHPRGARHRLHPTPLPQPHRRHAPDHPQRL